MTSASDPWRPRLHFSPRQHWINDPNGLVWHDGEYHLFFQHNPLAAVWGHMSWGHAVSTDLLHWQELPVAIPEDTDWMIFSGSVVVDSANASGFGDGTAAPMVAVYTGSAQQPDAAGVYRQTQQLAYSLDRGRHWTKYPGNPVLDLGMGGFRDPKVFWHAATACWVMLVSMADAGWLRLFGSSDLKRWSPLSEIRLTLPAGCRIWECPDLIELQIDGEPGRTAWLLKFDVFEGHPAGGSGALGVAGDFDGERFTPLQSPQWLDGSMDFYAAIAFGAMPPGDDRRVWLGWMNDHRYAARTPTRGWCGAMTLPRALGWRRAADGTLQLWQQPVHELEVALRQLLTWAARPIAPGVGSATGSTANESGNWLLRPGEGAATMMLVLTVGAAAGTTWWVDLCVNETQHTRVGVDRGRGELLLDRRQSGVAPDEASFAAAIHRLPWPCARTQDELTLRIVVDACSVEVFAGAGEAVLTALVFPPEGATGVRLGADGAAYLRAAQVWAWQAESEAAG